MLSLMLAMLIGFLSVSLFTWLVCLIFSITFTVMTAAIIWIVLMLATASLEVFSDIVRENR